MLRMRQSQTSSQLQSTTIFIYLFSYYYSFSTCITRTCNREAEWKCCESSPARASALTIPITTARPSSPVRSRFRPNKFSIYKVCRRSQVSSTYIISFPPLSLCRGYNDIDANSPFTLILVYVSFDT